MNNIISGPDEQFDEIAFLYNELMEGVPYNEWVKYLHLILKKLECKPKTILDLCCGTGTVSRLLANYGYKVAGVDISSEMIRIAKKQSDAEKINVDFYTQSAVNFEINKTFDLIVSFFDSLNYILEIEDLQSCFHHVYKHLNSGGYFIFDVNTRLALETGLFNQHNQGSSSPVIYKWVSSFDRETSLCAIEMNFTYHDNIKKHIVHYQRAYEIADIIAMLNAASLDIIAIYDAYSFRRINSKSDRAFFVVHKS